MPSFPSDLFVWVMDMTLEVNVVCGDLIHAMADCVLIYVHTLHK